VGSRLRAHLERAGWRVIPWTRQPEPGAEVVAFRLGDSVDPSLLQGVDALVHCAYDFGPRRWKEIDAINVAGSRKLFTAAQDAGVKSVVLISSISAFTGCRSLYGQAKLQIEDLARYFDAFILRPGLVYGDNPGGMFGRLLAQVRNARFVPILWGGRQTQYLVHDGDLGNLVEGCLTGRVPLGTGQITVAHEKGWELKEILLHVAQVLDRRISFLPVPWRLVWLGLKGLELAGGRPGLRSDSLISMVYQNPAPSFALLRSLGFRCRPFELRPAMLQ